MTRTKEGDGIDRIYCDSCHVQIAHCQFFTFEEGQETMYSGWFCEKCGREHNKFVGDTVKENEELKKKINEIMGQLRNLENDVVGGQY